MVSKMMAVFFLMMGPTVIPPVGDRLKNAGGWVREGKMISAECVELEFPILIEQCEQIKDLAERVAVCQLRPAGAHEIVNSVDAHEYTGFVFSVPK